MTKKSSLMSKFMVLLLAFAVVFTYSVMPMNQAYAASAKKPAKVAIKTAKAASASSVKVTWKKAKNAKKYEVYYSTKAKKGFKKGATVKASKKAATVKKLKAGTKYYFKVRAVNGKKKGAFSKVKAATTRKGVVETDPTIGATKSVTMTTTIDMSDSKYDGKTVKVWVPLPQTDAFQTISMDDNAIVAGIAADDVKITFDTVNNNKMLYILWGKTSAPEKRVATFKYNATRAKVSREELVYDTAADVPKEAKAYITEESEYVKVNDPTVQKAAKEAVGDAKGTLDQAKAIYDWVIANLERIDNGETLSNGSESHTFSVDGCGYGDTVKILTDFYTFGRAGGHCTDLNSTFVALCRANGIAAREMFGIRLNADATGGQHCWAEFYLPGTGWVYADPGDVLKKAKTGKEMSMEDVAKSKASDAVIAEQKALWGGVDNNRIVLSTGRDVTFEPAQAWGPCNTFGYPAAEVDGKRLETSFTDAKNFKYTISCGEAGFITAAALEENLAGYKILDARRAIDYKAAHIKGAVSADVSGKVTGTDPATAKANVEKAIAGDKAGTKYAIICYTGNKFANATRDYLLELGVGADCIFTLGQDDGTQGANGGMKAWGTREKVSDVDSVKESKVYVTPEWLYSAIAGGQKGYENIVICEVSYNINGGSNRADYESGHIPGAIPVSVVEVEDPNGNEGAYNLLDAETVKANLLKHGITSDTKVVLYSRKTGDLGVHRQAYAYLWCGVKDVKVLDGNLPLWTYDLETTSNEGKETAATDFGVSVPAHPEYWTSIEDARAKADSDLATYDPNFKLVSIRAENEWLGVNSGYDYIDFAGEPKGAVWGKGANGAYDVAQFLNEDGTVKNLDGFKAVWKDCDFKTDDSQHLAFYCGTGWRATVPFLALYENGYKHISVYDGGWWEWLFGKTGDYDITKAVRSNLDYPVQVWNAEKNAFDYTTVGALPAGKAAK